MSKKNKSEYGDNNTPEIDMPKNCHRGEKTTDYEVEPLPESERPRKDGPGGN